MPAPLFLSSGDLIADRRYDFARDLQLRGDLEAAADLMAQAAELAPNFASAWFALGELREQLQQSDAAIIAYRRACEADSDDRHGATLRLMRLGAQDLSGMPPAYVRSLFDQYAPNFENALLNDLNYRGPEVVFDAVIAACHALKRPPFFKTALDLGCGTGLAARAFARNVDIFVGVDLSAGMIARARETQLYQRLETADMITALAAEKDASFDLVLSADSLVYLPDLSPALAETARVLKRGGFVAFTTETHTGDDVVLGRGLRYAHGAAHVKRAVAASELKLLSLSAVSTRTEHNEPVPGLVAVASRA